MVPMSAKIVHLSTIYFLLYLTDDLRKLCVPVHRTLYCAARLPIRVERERLFLRGQNRATNQRSGMILEVQNRRFSAHARGAHLRIRTKVFIFKKLQEA